MILYMAVTPDEFEQPLHIAETVGELAEIYGISNNTILSSIAHKRSGKHRGAKFIRIEDGELKKRKCKHCGKVFIPKNQRYNGFKQIYCGVECRAEANYEGKKRWMLNGGKSNSGTISQAIRR